MHSKDLSKSEHGGGIAVSVMNMEDNGDPVNANEFKTPLASPAAGACPACLPDLSAALSVGKVRKKGPGWLSFLPSYRFSRFSMTDHPITSAA